MRRDERRRRENRGVVGAEGEGNVEGVPIPNRLGGLGERRELPQRAPAENEFVAFCGR